MFFDCLKKYRARKREKFRQRKEEADQEAVRSGMCAFPVNYLGSIEVYQPRGMSICHGAFKVMRKSKRKHIRAILLVSGDKICVLSNDMKKVIVEQQIENVSYCSPDRHNKKGFSFICKDHVGLHSRCHVFLSKKNSGRRLNRAVAYAFKICLQKKQSRQKEFKMKEIFEDPDLILSTC